MNTVTLQAHQRDPKTKSPALRRQGYVPAILYGHEVKNVPLQVKYSDLLKTYRHAGSSTLVELQFDHDKRTVLIHDLDHDPVSDNIIHADFYQVKLTEKIKAEIPLVLVGESPAVKELEGTLLNNKDHVNVEALPQDLVHEITVDISVLKTFEDTIDIKDLVTPKGITVLDNPDEMVVLVQPPRSEEELAELEQKVEEAEEVEKVEVEEKGKKEEEEAQAEAAEQPPTESTQKKGK